MTDACVLIVSTAADAATDGVVQRLTKAGVTHLRINTEDLPFSKTFAFWNEYDGPCFELPQLQRAPTTIWYRRLRVPGKPEGMDDGVYSFCLQENRAAFLGSIMSLRCRWMSHPASVWQSEHKPYQLSLASRFGLKIPRTLITNDPEAIRNAFRAFGSRVAKPARTGYLVYGERPYSIFTSRVLEEHLVGVESAQLSPAIYQELIPKKFDLRVTIVDKEIYVAAIDSQSDPAAMIDWRKTSNAELPHHRVQLPTRVSDQLLQLTSALGLTFAAVDMIQSTDDDYIFLEVNPNGQWLWLDDILDLGISDSIASWLGDTNV